jgi:hypothetical protein
MRLYLYHEENEGLFFIWQTEQQSKEDPDKMQQSLISSFVKEMRYQYYNAEDDTWEEEVSFLDQDKNTQGNNQTPIPDMIKLDFEWPDGRKESSTILLPPNMKTAPIY